MRTIIENKENTRYNSHLEEMDVHDIFEKDIHLVRSSFYDFAVKHELTFGGYSEEEESEFINNL